MSPYKSLCLLLKQSQCAYNGLAVEENPLWNNTHIHLGVKIINVSKHQEEANAQLYCEHQHEHI